MPKETRRDLLVRLHSEDRLSEDEFRTLAGPSLGWATALYYVGGGLLLIGAIALGAEIWILSGSFLGHLAIGLAVTLLLFGGAFRLRAEHEVPAVLLLLGSLLSWTLIVGTLLRQAGPPLTASFPGPASSTPLGDFAASAAMLLLALAYLFFWRAPLMTAAVVAAAAVFVGKLEGLYCNGATVCATAPQALFVFGLLLLSAGLWRDRTRLAQGGPPAPDHAIWFSLAGLLLVDFTAPQIWSWNTAAGALFLALQAATLALAVPFGRYALGVIAAVGAVAYLDAEIFRLLPSGDLLAPLAAVALGAAALCLGIVVRRKVHRRPMRVYGSPWL